MATTRVLFPVRPVALLPGDWKDAGRQSCSLDQRSSNTRLGPVRKQANRNRSVSLRQAAARGSLWFYRSGRSDTPRSKNVLVLPDADAK